MIWFIIILYLIFVLKIYLSKIEFKNGSYNMDTDQTNFIDAEYRGDSLDDSQNWLEEGPFVTEEEQEYLHRDYSQIIFTRFPLFEYSSKLPQKWRYYKQANAEIRASIKRDVNWTNQTISYMRNRRSFKVILDILYENNITTKNIVDATANIGGDSISFAMLGYNVKAYEMNPVAFEILKNNVSLYNVDIELINGKFDYNVPHDSLVIIDPPFERGNNKDNMNLSIDNMPICAVCDKILDAGAKYVILTMPRDYLYNIRYANDHNQTVLAYNTSKNVKIFLCYRKNDS